jgi:bacillithiol system protein YtxJ
MSPTQFSPETDLDELLASHCLLLFKHSPTCPVSARAFFEYRAFLEKNPDIDSVWLDVIEQRPASLAIAEATGITHQSPQAFWITNGTITWHASHGAITRAALATATRREC